MILELNQGHRNGLPQSWLPVSLSKDRVSQLDLSVEDTAPIIEVLAYCDGFIISLIEVLAYRDGARFHLCTRQGDKIVCKVGPA